VPSPGSDAAAQLQLRWVSVSTGVILVAVRWYLRYPLSYREVEELLAERGIEVDYVTIYCWVQRFTPLLIDAAWPCQHAAGDRWFVDETSRLPVAGFICTGRSTSTARSLMFSCPSSGIWRPPASSSPAPSSTVHARLR
jgi:hypothetical protein